MVAVGRETTPDCTRTRLPKSSNSTSFPGGRATLDSSGASSSLPCPLIIVPHCPPSSLIHSIQFTHISSSGFLVLLQVLSISISRSFQQHPLCKDNRCTKKNIYIFSLHILLPVAAFQSYPVFGKEAPA